MSRLFNFEGCDAEYIRFLESKLLESQRISVHDSNSSLGAPIAAQQNQNGEQDTPEIQIVLYEPKLDKTRIDFGHRTVPKWKKQLNEFISSIPREKDWGWARHDAGIYTIQRNRWAIQLMLGRTTESIFPSQDALAAGLPSIQPADNENKELILRGCKYGKFMSACADEGNFALRVTEYQKLIFTSYCAVLMHAGNSKETVYSMMRQYINKEYDDKTLDNYRYGAVWVNRCIALLLKQGWGHRCWEIFLLQGRSSAQFGRFAAHSSHSFERVAKELGVKHVPIYEVGWIPYCLPCIVKSLVGNAIGLPEICKCLGYESEQVVISSIHKIFFQSFDPFHYMTGETYAEPFVPLDPIQAMSDSMEM